MITLAPITAYACGTLAPAQQRELDRAELDALRKSVVRKVMTSDLIFVGTVSALQRPNLKTDQPGQVTFVVSETLKGSSCATIELPWMVEFVISCRPADMFGNVGFADKLSYIVYVTGGRITRSADTRRSGNSSSLSFAEERKIVLAASSKS
ncbi:MAG TPA: hypothetical protein VFN25_02010 [Dokdonella sp.]|uniref:hypothetical protein n=1 Tax=Dokdonella sp. TaxID=2291710 RepID=UPI002D80A04B|nr:hypothetical protein [Dokdonella sp.]HET9031659.1 hypothetical protein [Dokdonella sp.]